MPIDIGARVSIHRAGSDGRTGVVVGGTMWFNSESDPGDRVVLMDDTGEQLCFEGWMLAPLPGAPDRGQMTGTLETIEAWQAEHPSDRSLDDAWRVIRNARDRALYFPTR